MPTEKVVRNPPVKIDPEFGTWLKRTRLGMRLGTEQFAEVCGVNRSTITNFELNRRAEAAFSIGTFVRLARGLNMELGYVLHKAGFDIGVDGINLTRLRRAEAAVEAFAGRERLLRAAFAEAMAAVDKPNAAGEEGRETERLVVLLGRALGALDLVTERLRQAGYVPSSDRPEGSTTVRAWTETERDFIRQNSHLSNEELGEQLGRSANAVRGQRSPNRSGDERNDG